MNGISHPLFRDRAHAGAILAEELKEVVGARFLILGLPRGGVVLGAEVARRLNIELDVLVIRKVGVPGREELAMGAVGPGGVHVFNRRLAHDMGVSEEQSKALIAKQKRAVEERSRRYRGETPPPGLSSRSVCLIDDGLATGSTMATAVEVVRRHGPSRIIVAVPVAPPEVCAQFKDQVDLLVCPYQPAHFLSVGMWYEDFAEVTDDDVCALLSATAQARSHLGGTSSS